MVAALLAPPLYELAHTAWVVEHLPSVAKFPFARCFNRAILIAALSLIWPFWRWLGITKVSELGLVSNPYWLRDLLRGFMLSASGVALLSAGLLYFHMVAWRKSWDATSFVWAALTAIIVALIEESFFRGALFGALRRNWRWQPALAFLSILFGIVHFLKPRHKAMLGPVDALSGFKILPHVFWQLTQPQKIVSSLLALILVGAILGYTVVRTRSLFMAIGLHAGWVFGLKSFMTISKTPKVATVWLGKDPLSGLLPLGLLVLTALAVMWSLRHVAIRDRH